ncbi:hypothetical protein CAEBREN_07326 [Caenorhabditis brenneri]|uniref:NTF2-like domain-containing protein n=1 Tax=Caenorhabditis brenneri TaxID=135651 RepID=G0PDZ2_CAEBE|nr:hypothetical protein CAEBREN_07326 [Caenorhabditis brenneri]
MLSKILFLSVLALTLNGIEDTRFQVWPINDCFELCPDRSALLRVHVTIDKLNTEVQRRSNDIGNHIHDHFKYTASGQTVMNKAGFVSSLKKLPREQFVFIRCNDIKHTTDSLSCNGEIHGPNYGNVSTVRIAFHEIFEKVIGFDED